MEGRKERRDGRERQEKRDDRGVGGEIRDGRGRKLEGRSEEAKGGMEVKG